MKRPISLCIKSDLLSLRPLHITDPIAPKQKKKITTEYRKFNLEWEGRR